MSGWFDESVTTFSLSQFPSPASPLPIQTGPFSVPNLRETHGSAIIRDLVPLCS